MARRRGGYSLIEALVAVAVTGIGVTAALSAMSAMTRAEGNAREHDLRQRLAHEKYDEMIATGEYVTAPNGDFSDRDLPDYTYTVETEPSGTQNLDIVRVIVRNETLGDAETRAVGVVFVPPVAEEEGG